MVQPPRPCVATAFVGGRNGAAQKSPMSANVLASEGAAVESWALDAWREVLPIIMSPGLYMLCLEPAAWDPATAWAEDALAEGQSRNFFTTEAMSFEYVRPIPHGLRALKTVAGVLGPDIVHPKLWWWTWCGGTPHVKSASAVRSGNTPRFCTPKLGSNSPGTTAFLGVEVASSWGSALCRSRSRQGFGVDCNVPLTPRTGR
mmetsp:Transcript_72158/g.181882  ORF Transcript_72158/g.181882 Transcript_72158/m.181882 type:complete len:202 (+) Transcript_72158:186-791(+)